MREPTASPASPPAEPADAADEDSRGPGPAITSDCESPTLPPACAGGTAYPSTPLSATSGRTARIVHPAAQRSKYPFSRPLLQAINASHVDSSRSMFSHHCLGMYLTVGAVIVHGAIIRLALCV